MRRRILSLLLALSLLCALLPQAPIPAFAETHSGRCGNNLTWRFDSGTGTLTIEGSGPMWDADYYDLWWKDYLPQITSVSLPEGLTSIGDYAFYECYNLQEIYLPVGLTSIGNYAFCNCVLLSEITIPATVRSIGEKVFSSRKWQRIKITVLCRDADIHRLAFDHVTPTIYGYAHSSAQTVALRGNNDFVDLDSGEYDWVGSNQDRQDYNPLHQECIDSYLYEDSAGNLVRVEEDDHIYKVFVADYNENYQRISARELEQELFFFGGFYCGKDYNFLIFNKVSDRRKIHSSGRNGVLQWTEKHFCNGDR